MKFAKYVLGALVAAAALAAAARVPGLLPKLIYEALLACGLCAVFFPLVLTGRPAGGISGGGLFWLVAVPALLQMFLSVYYPLFFWVLPLALLVVLFKYVLPYGKKHAVSYKAEKKIYFIIGYVLLPVVFWDWKQYFSPVMLWWFAAWSYKRAA